MKRIKVTRFISNIGSVIILILLLLPTSVLCAKKQPAPSSHKGLTYEIILEEPERYIGRINLRLNEEMGTPGTTLKVLSHTKDHEKEEIVVDCTDDNSGRKYRLKLPLNFHSSINQKCGDTILSFVGTSSVR